VFSLLRRWPFGPVLADLGRALRTIAVGAQQPQACLASPTRGLLSTQYDFDSLAPDQVQEMRYGLGRRGPRRSGANR